MTQIGSRRIKRAPSLHLRTFRIRDSRPDPVKDDKLPTQRVGIIPDIEVKPTLAGRGELLEAALRQILGPKVSTEEIRKLSVVAQ